MTSTGNTSVSEARKADWFLTTHWSVVLAAGSDSVGAEQALERLCRAYWYPLYVYVRRIGEDAENARDLTQGFFARLLQKNYLGQVQPDKGRFRSFLLASLKHYLSDERDKARAQKRGGEVRFLSLDDPSVEDRYRLEPVDGRNAENLFERRWALALLHEARDLLRQEYADRGQSELYDQLKVFDSGDPSPPSYAEVALKLDIAEGSVKSAVSRMRARYRELVRQAVAATVAGQEEIDDEIRYLISIISA